MAISVFQLFSIGVGPSSSHTVGPMRAALMFVQKLEEENKLKSVNRIVIDLYGSLALTGKGHATDIAVILGLLGYAPDKVDPDAILSIISTIRKNQSLSLLNQKSIGFHESTDLLFHGDRQLPFHPNGMRFSAYDGDGQVLLEEVYYSVGGGFIVEHNKVKGNESVVSKPHQLPYPFKTAEELLAQCRKYRMTIPQLMMENEKSWRAEQEVKSGILHIWAVMKACIDRGCHQEGILPGGLNVRRRAGKLYKNLSERKKNGKVSPAEVMEWVSLWALAVNEENASGGRVVTAPTNGAAGVIPAVVHYLIYFHPDTTDDQIVAFFLTAAAIGILYKEGASISAAEMGCMGEVGVACSMAAGGLTAALGGSNEQIENAAEIGMEHNLGLTCDPIMGLVQIPCIERNTMGAVKAINAMLLAMQGDGIHRVSLDQVIATMRQTGHDMKSIYKETSQGGLAVNVPEC